jgi:U1 small nuclear ribonucleoprotein
VKGWKPHKLGGGLGGRPKPVDPVAVAPVMAPVLGGGFRGGMGGGFRGGDRGGFRGGVSDNDLLLVEDANN